MLDQSLTRVKSIGTLQSHFMCTWLLMGRVASAGKPIIRGGGKQCRPCSCHLRGQEQALMGLVWHGEKLAFLTLLPEHGGLACMMA